MSPLLSMFRLTSDFSIYTGVQNGDAALRRSCLHDLNRWPNSYGPNNGGVYKATLIQNDYDTIPARNKK